MLLRRIRGVSRAVAIAFGLSQIGLPGLVGEDKVMPSAQSGAVASASQEPGTTTVMVPQDQVTYQTVYDVECVQVPTTQLQTQYKTEYRSQTVPVTRVVTEQVPTTQMQTQYKTEYRTQTVPVTRTIVEQVPTTQMQTQYKTEYRTQTIPVTRTVAEQVPTTQMRTQYKTEYKTQTIPVTRTIVEQVPTTLLQTQYKTEYRTQTVPVRRTVAEVVNVPRTYTVYVPRQQTVNQQMVKTILEPVNQTAETVRVHHRHENRTTDAISASDDDRDDDARADFICTSVVYRIGAGDDLHPGRRGARVLPDAADCRQIPCSVRWFRLRWWP